MKATTTPFSVFVIGGYGFFGNCLVERLAPDHRLHITLSGAAADALATGMARLRRVDIGIIPGNRTERGLSTVQGILSHRGKALPTSGGRWVFGWSGTHRHGYPEPVGPRLLSPCDVPDRALLPRYECTPAVRFSARLEDFEREAQGLRIVMGMDTPGLFRMAAGGSP